MSKLIKVKLNASHRDGRSTFMANGQAICEALRELRSLLAGDVVTNGDMQGFKARHAGALEQLCGMSPEDFNAALEFSRRQRNLDTVIDRVSTTKQLQSVIVRRGFGE